MDIFTGLNKEGYTVIIATHDVDVAKRAKKILYLRDGHIIKTENNEIELK